MAFQLKLHEPVGEGVKRCVRREIEKSIEALGPDGKHKLTDTEAMAAVHEIRKGFKKVRAALRLTREELGDELYHRENCFFRDAARPLTDLRDAEMLLEAVEKLARQIDHRTLANLRKALRENQEEVARRVLDDDHALAAAHGQASRALARVPTWILERNGWLAIETGIKRVYRDGRRALTVASETTSVENLHEWRKQAKYLWHHLQLLELSWTEAEADFGDRVHNLTRLLGEDHDLAVLRRTLAADPLAFGGHTALKELFVSVDRQRQTYQKEALALGSELYAQPPGEFISRMAAYWNAWTETPPLSSADSAAGSRLPCVGGCQRESPRVHAAPASRTTAPANATAAQMR